MSFLQVLEQRGLSYVIASQQFKAIIPQGGSKFAKLIKRIVTENLSVFIDYDCDPDGYFSAKILVDTFNLLGYTQYTLCRHIMKRHSLTQAYGNSIIREHYDVVFVLDSSTNDMELITSLAEAGSICCVVDHHMCDYMFVDYPPSAIIVNPQIDAKMHPVVYNCLSAGAITALLCAYTLQSEFGIRPPQDLYLYGVITLYSDIMDLNNEYNIAYISRFQNTSLISSKLIRLFWDERYDHFDRSYISFKLIPRLNALFRTENFELLYKLFFEIEELNLADVKERINVIYADCKTFTKKLVDLCTVTLYEDFAIAVIPKSMNDTLARNFTGLVASTLSSNYGVPVMCLHQTTPDKWAGSVRDPFSRDLLSVFKNVCYAAGHRPAFGVEICPQDLDMITGTLAGELPEVSESASSIIMIDWDAHPEDFKSDLKYMALFNEFGGQGLPVAMGALKIKPNFKIYRDERKLTVYGNSEKFLVFKNTADVGDVMLIKPTSSGAAYTNMVNAIHLE